MPWQYLLLLKNGDTSLDIAKFYDYSYAMQQLQEYGANATVNLKPMPLISHALSIPEVYTMTIW